MPTGNRSSNTEMVSVPRELLARIEAALDRHMAGHAPMRIPADQTDSDLVREELQQALAQPRQQEQGEPVKIPEGYCVMPRRLTAENGAKALLIGEFKLEITEECAECAELEEPAEDCGICHGAGEYAQPHVIPWDQIKLIYSEAVKDLALKQ